jgi:hypothetical protein
MVFSEGILTDLTLIFYQIEDLFRGAGCHPAYK